MTSYILRSHRLHKSARSKKGVNKWPAPVFFFVMSGKTTFSAQIEAIACRWTKLRLLPNTWKITSSDSRSVIISFLFPQWRSLIFLQRHRYSHNLAWLLGFEQEWQPALKLILLWYAPPSFLCSSNFVVTWLFPSHMTYSTIFRCTHSEVSFSPQL